MGKTPCRLMPIYGWNAAKTALSLGVEFCQSMEPSGVHGRSKRSEPAGSLAGPVKTPGNPLENFYGLDRGADYNEGIVFVLTRHEWTRGRRHSVKRFLDWLCQNFSWEGGGL